MTKTVCTCDICGKAITDKLYRIRIGKVSDDTTTTDGEKEICEACYNSYIIDNIGTTISKTSRNTLITDFEKTDTFTALSKEFTDLVESSAVLDITNLRATPSGGVAGKPAITFSDSTFTALIAKVLNTWYNYIEASQVEITTDTTTTTTTDTSTTTTTATDSSSTATSTDSSSTATTTDIGTTATT